MNGSTSGRTATLNSRAFRVDHDVTMTGNNRRFYRLDGEWTVVCQPLDDAGVPGPSIGGRTRNLSAGGAELVLQEPVEPGQRMTVRLAADELRLCVEATVMRAADGNVAGVRFEDLDRTQRADLSRFVFAQARLRQAGAGTTDESAA
jgi:c-di-GMP-binding flagellar brake protein YcgR